MEGGARCGGLQRLRKYWEVWGKVEKRERRLKGKKQIDQK